MRALLFLLLFASLPTLAEPYAFGVFHQGALARHVPLPAPGVGPGGDGWRATLDWTSEYVALGNAHEALRLDGEALRIGLMRRMTFGGWQFGAELPLLLTGGGIADDPIETWHGWFGLPNGGRQYTPQNRYRYTYAQDGVTHLNLREPQSGLGDARLYAARCNHDDACWRALLQLPTGDADQLMGGGLGLSLWHEQSYRLDTHWNGALGAGAAALHPAGPLQEYQRSFIPFGWVSLGRALNERMTLGAQLYLHGPLYEGIELAQLSHTGGQLAFGLRYRQSKSVSLWLGMQEDIVVNASPDVSLHIAVDF